LGADPRANEAEQTGQNRYISGQIRWPIGS
jgi:hypothetical protein